jgi:hypothetical protein
MSERLAKHTVYRSAFERPDELFVELRHRRHLARAQALDLGQRQFAAGRRLARPDVQALGDSRQQMFRAAQHARQARADSKLASARRPHAEHRAEGHHLGTFETATPKGPTHNSASGYTAGLNGGINRPRDGWEVELARRESGASDTPGSVLDADSDVHSSRVRI